MLVCISVCCSLQTLSYTALWWHRFRSSSSYDFEVVLDLEYVPQTATYDPGGLFASFYFQARKDSLRHGLGAALAGRLVRQTDQDGLKWHLLKQVLRVRALLFFAFWLGIIWLDLTWVNMFSLGGGLRCPLSVCVFS